MSTVIGVMGQSGHGKTTSLYTLDPQSTFVINADGKPLPWRGWTKQYNAEAGNYLATRDAATIQSTLDRIDGMPHIKVAVVDTINAVMINEEMTRMREKGYDKWVDICQFVYDLIVKAGSLRSDLIVVLLFHVAIAADGEGVDHILTNGRKLEKVHLEFLLTILVYAKSRMVNGRNDYYLEVHANESTAKTPMGLYDLDTLETENDMAALCEEVRKYQAGDDMPTTKPTESSSPDVTKLIELMAQDGIANHELAALCVGKGWLKEDDRDFSHLSPDVITAMIDPANWIKVRMKLVTHLKGIKTLMDLSGITDAQLNAYCNARKWGDDWHDVDRAILSQMSQTENWDKVAAKLKA